MKCREVMEHLEVLAPARFAEGWDNVGLLTGRLDKEIRKVYISLDATDAAVEEAAGWGADMLLTHHPIIFKPLKQVNDGHFIGRRIVKLLQSDICCFAMHTNFDLMGMADAAADELRIRNRQVLSVTYEDEIAKEGIGRYGNLPESMTLKECALYVKETFRLPAVRVYGRPEDTVEIAAVSPGSAGSIAAAALEAGVDVLISGDIDHHLGIDMEAQGVYVIDAGHYGLEKIFVPYMRAYFLRNMPGVQVETAPEQSPYSVV